VIIDIHAHLWGGQYAENKAEIVRACQRHGLTRCYISGLGAFQPDPEEIAELNREVYRFQREEPGLIQGYAYVNPNHGNALAVLQRCVEEWGMAGMKLWVACYCDAPQVYPLVEQCIDYRIPVLLHTFHKRVGQLPNESLATHVARLAKRYPEAKLIMAHLGGNCYHGIKVVQAYPNVFVDFSGSMFRRGDLDYACRLLGAERILFGSDLPVADPLVSLGQVEEADLMEAEKEVILHKNALALFARRSGEVENEERS
jgi:predicted TIM-barrel fold metal-dependent hydrolase